ncbi:uncharacterized protein LOC111632177 [Centruroides sculpturatus]|uniref:uncharacterized protein LOC111632177 n=1 Tax=Centruroides sculpturatus TaxID=218467 RepID=UPI000C6EA108|nr:uncharacterized protein LOC111632177 [Centruroides sculpturatus]
MISGILETKIFMEYTLERSGKLFAGYHTLNETWDFINIFSFDELIFNNERGEAYVLEEKDEPDKDWEFNNIFNFNNNVLYIYLRLQDYTTINKKIYKQYTFYHNEKRYTCNRIIKIMEDKEVVIHYNQEKQDSGGT